MFGSKKSGGVPDVGEEDVAEETTDKETKKDESLPELNVAAAVKGAASAGVSDVRVEQLDAKLDTVTNWMKQVYERFSYISESIGEMRSMNLNNEKQIVQAIKDSAQAAELVKEVQPQTLRMDSKKTNLRVDVLDEKIGANKQFVDSVLEQFKDIQRKAEVFSGTEGVLKLNDDVKKELIEVQKLASQARLDADKSQEIFMELKKTLSEMQKMNSEFVSFNNTSNLMKKDIEKVKIDHSKVIGDEEFADLKSMIDRKFKTLDVYVGTVVGIKKTHERSVDLIEKVLRMTKANKENIDSLAMSIGNDNIKRVSDYEIQMDGMLKLIDSLAGQISEIKKQVGMKPKIPIAKPTGPLISANNLTMQHIAVPKHIVKQIVPRRAVVPTMVAPVPVKKVVVSKKVVAPKKVVVSKKVAVKKKIVGKKGATVKKVAVEEKPMYPEDKEISLLEKRISDLASQI